MNKVVAACRKAAARVVAAAESEMGRSTAAETRTAIPASKMATVTRRAAGGKEPSTAADPQPPPRQLNTAVAGETTAVEEAVAVFA